MDANQNTQEGIGRVGLLGVEFVEACRHNSLAAPSLEDVRKTLSVFSGSVSELICQEREER